MRIIDKNHDFYDYLQDPTDDRTVFDRRNSFLLTKDMVCDKLYCPDHRNDSNHRFLLLQCGSTFWLFLLTITERRTARWSTISDITNYDLELLSMWKNYDKDRKLISFTMVDFLNLYSLLPRWLGGPDEDFYNKLKSAAGKLQYSIDHNEFRVRRSFDRYEVARSYKNTYVTEIKDVPLLHACGVSELVDPQLMFCAIEEYFSMEKTAAETTEPKGATNDDKIIMHGFDTKTSFRGKQKKQKEGN